MIYTSYENYILDLLLPLGGITIRKMFGGLGIYKDGVFFALIANNVLYFKVDKFTQINYTSFSSKPFTYTRNNKVIALSYWELPINILENQTKLAEYVKNALQAAQRAKK